MSNISWNSLTNILNDIISSNTNEQEYKNIMKVLKDKKDEISPLLLSSKTKRIKDPNAPKKWKTSYIFFCSEQRELLRNQNQKYKTTEITSKLADMWKKLSPSERVKYEELSNKDKERYNEEKTTYSSPEEFKKKEKPLIKRPTTSYMYFCMDERVNIKNENPTMSAKEITSQLGKRWRILTEEQKKPYIERQNNDKLRYSTQKSELERNLPQPAPKQRVRKTAPVKTAKKQPRTKQTKGFKNFCEEQRTSLKEDNPDWSSAKIKQELNVMWNDLNDEDKQEYEDIIAEENDIDLDD